MYFGSPQSQTLLRIYDKRLELQSKGQENYRDYGTRWELELKKDRAEQCARALATLDEADWKELVIGLLRSYVDFRQIPKDAEDEERYRAPMLEWYALLTEGFQKGRLAQEKQVQTLQTVKRWVCDTLTPANARRNGTSVRQLRAYFGNPKLSQITPKHIVAYKNKRYADGVKPATINRELSTLKKAFNLARREWEWCSDNPVCRVSMEKEDNTRDRWLTLEEEQRLLQSALPWLLELLVFAIHTGMRMGEIVSLTWAGVDLSRRSVTVFRSKNGERRTIPANETVLELLGKKEAIRRSVSDLVFHSQTGTPLDGSNIRRCLNSALKTAKIHDLHFHDLRHTFATRMVQAGVDLYKVQRLLGHKSPVMTQRYAHHYPESLRDGVEVLDRRRPISTNLAQSPSRSGQISLTH